MSRRTVGRAGGLFCCAALVWWSARRARAGAVSPGEERVFRTFNTASDDLEPAVWTVMQGGSFAAVPVVAVMTVAKRGKRPGIVVAAAGTAAWLLAKGLKSLVERGRPADLLPDVIVRGKPQSGLGYPSGHAAVALTLALAATWGRASRLLAVCAAGLAAGGRLYTGAHLPLDAAGGFGLGAIIGGAVVVIGQRGWSTLGPWSWTRAPGGN